MGSIYWRGLWFEGKSVIYDEFKIHKLLLRGLWNTLRAHVSLPKGRPGRITYFGIFLCFQTLCRDLFFELKSEREGRNFDPAGRSCKLFMSLRSRVNGIYSVARFERRRSPRWIAIETESFFNSSLLTHIFLPLILKRCLHSCANSYFDAIAINFAPGTRCYNKKTQNSRWSSLRWDQINWVAKI